MRTALVIVPPPSLDLGPGVRQRQEPMRVQALGIPPARAASNIAAPHS